MTEKATLPKEVADAIEHLRKGEQRTNFGIIAAIMEGRYSDQTDVIKRWANEGGIYDVLISALVNGYTVEQPVLTPHEKLRNHYERHAVCSNPELTNTYAGIRAGIGDTLEILGVKVDGINT